MIPSLADGGYLGMEIDGGAWTGPLSGRRSFTWLTRHGLELKGAIPAVGCTMERIGLQVAGVIRGSGL